MSNYRIGFTHQANSDLCASIARGILHRFMRCGSAPPVNGRLRDECLNEHWFMSLPAARSIVEAWRKDYNAVRPHSALGNRTPEEFAEQVARKTPVGL